MKLIFIFFLTLSGVFFFAARTTGEEGAEPEPEPEVIVNARFEELCADKKVQVISDVDDTMQASGPNKAAGCDNRWNAGVAYAGVHQFFLELARGPKEIENPEGMVVASARPSILGEGFKTKIDTSLEATAQKNNIHNVWGKIKEVLHGAVDDFMKLDHEARFKAYGGTKVLHISEFSATNPELCAIFVGDNGQGDHYAGDQLLASGDDVDENIAVVFIHNVTSNPHLPVQSNDNIYLFSTYPDAAWTAYLNGIISRNGVQRVLESSIASAQYEDCGVCVKSAKKCQIIAASPGPFSDDGGCTTLLNDIEEVAKRIGFAVEVPQHIVLNDVNINGIYPWLIVRLFSLFEVIVLGVMIYVHTQK